MESRQKDTLESKYQIDIKKLQIFDNPNSTQGKKEENLKKVISNEKSKQQVEPIGPQQNAKIPSSQPNINQNNDAKLESNKYNPLVPSKQTLALPKAVSQDSKNEPTPVESQSYSVQKEISPNNALGKEQAILQSQIQALDLNQQQENSPPLLVEQVLINQEQIEKNLEQIIPLSQSDDVEDPMIRLQDEKSVEIDMHTNEVNNSNTLVSTLQPENSTYITPRDSKGGKIEKGLSISLKMTPDVKNLKMTPHTVSNSSSNQRLPTCATTTGAQSLSTDSSIPINTLPNKATTISAPILGPPPIQYREERDYERMVSITQRKENQNQYWGSFHYMIPEENSPMLENYQFQQLSYLEGSSFYPPEGSQLDQYQKTIDYRGPMHESTPFLPNTHIQQTAPHQSQTKQPGLHHQQQQQQMDRKSLFFGPSPAEQYFFDQYACQQPQSYMGNQPQQQPPVNNYTGLPVPTYGMMIMHPQNAYNPGPYMPIPRNNMNQPQNLHNSGLHYQGEGLINGNSQPYYPPNINELSYYSTDMDGQAYLEMVDGHSNVDDGSSFQQQRPSSGSQGQTQRRRKKYEIKESQESQFDIILDEIENDGRTTLMVQNIPNQYTRNMLLQTFNDKYAQSFDFFYLPIDFQNNCNMGYAFINFIDTKYIRSFYTQFNGKKWERYNSDKIRSIKYARIQGRESLEQHFQSSSVMNQQQFKPVFLPISSVPQFEKILEAQRKNCK